MWTAIKSIFSLFKEALTENGRGSYSRLTGASIVFCTLGWVTYLVIRTQALPDLAGATAFVSIGAGTHYAINQVKSVASAIKGNGSSNAN